MTIGACAELMAGARMMAATAAPRSHFRMFVPPEFVPKVLISLGIG
jgi:hypothetical protein